MGSDLPRRSVAEATLSAFEPPTREALVPILLYKSVFLGDWFEALVAREPDLDVRAALAAIARDTFRETIEFIDTMRPWRDIPHDPAVLEETTPVLQRRLVHDLLHLKEGNNEAMLYLAMRAPTDELRRKLVRLADRDREHANALRSLLGTQLPADPAPDDGAIGARERRAAAGTLLASVKADLARFQAANAQVMRLVLSPGALRHLRDEGVVERDGTALGIPVDVDFAWSGESHSFLTDERVRLSELLSRELDDP